MKWDFSIAGKLVGFPTKDGVFLQGFLIPAKDSKKIVIHIPGMGSNFYDDSRLPHLANQITKAGYSFLSVNNRGHDVIADIPNTKNKWIKGGTAFEKFEDSIKDIRASIDFASKVGYKKIILSGHSTGCQKIAYYKSKTNDKHVKGIVFIAPADDYNYIKKELGKTFNKVLNKARKLNKKDLLPPEMVKGNFLSAKRFLSVSDLKNMEAKIFNYDSDLDLFSKIRCPILAVFGSKEQYRLKPVQEYFKILQKNTSSPKFDSLLIKNANHSFIGKEKELAKKVANWVRNLNL